MSEEPALVAVANKILKCSSCALRKTCHRSVPGNGVARPLVMAIGEGPGAVEDETGEPFVGPAGQLLDQMLAAIQLSRFTNVFIGNIVKCRPPENRNPLPEEAEACRPWLDSQIEALKPAAILALGKVAARYLLGIEDTMSAMHGRFFDYRNVPVLVTYHPSALLRNEAMKRPAWEDLKIFKHKLLDFAPGYDQPGYYSRPGRIPVNAYCLPCKIGE